MRHEMSEFRFWNFHCRPRRPPGPDGEARETSVEQTWPITPYRAAALRPGHVPAMSRPSSCVAAYRRRAAAWPHDSPAGRGDPHHICANHVAPRCAVTIRSSWLQSGRRRPGVYTAVIACRGSRLPAEVS